jgi:protein SCO1/2
MNGAPHAGSWRLTLLAVATILTAGLTLIAWQTEGGRAFTSESLRRLQVERDTPPVPALAVIDERGKTQLLPELVAAGPPVWIADFFYARCTSLCLAQGTVMAQLQRQILEQGLERRVGLLSISFDPAHDRPDELRAYARRMGAEARVWRFATLARPHEHRTLLAHFGLVVIPAPLGEFEHNAALYVISADGRLLHIEDMDAPQRSLAYALRAAALADHELPR